MEPEVSRLTNAHHCVLPDEDELAGPQMALGEMPLDQVESD